MSSILPPISQWDRSPDLTSLLPSSPLPQTTSLQFIHAGLSGRIVGTKEVVSHQPTSSSTSARKAQLEQQKLKATQRKGMNFVRGRSGGMMFAPGGLEEGALLDEFTADAADTQANGMDAEVGRVEEAIKEWGRGLRTIPPGFERGIRTNLDQSEADEDDDEDPTGELRTEDPSKGLVPAPVYQPQLRASLKIDGAPEPQKSKSAVDEELDELLPTEKPQVKSSRTNLPIEKLEKRDWAHVVDATKRLTNFNELVPDMAHKYPFTLDPFQQEAVYHLEQGDSVFVAAHTSAGKTVVAEYAVALAQKHMTRCIYTSPIKALSNQKFRDFKQTFGAENVGILTGDVQINPEAPCLIMTTEILRSMLYRGADLIRDVEFVIFDEVHYVNDQERGVVWEEVIILCPAHISLILLSATVPNTKEFADWVGRTKKKDIYVISTSKRPVPLEHFLYANKDLHKIVNAQSKFLESGIKEAGDALKRKQDKEREAAGIAQPTRQGARGGAAGGANSRGGRGGASNGPQRGGAAGRGSGPVGRGRGGASTMARTMGGDTKNLWVHMTGLLKKRDLLPVVVFVFSKKRCEDYASSIPNTDLCTAREKSEVHVVIERSLLRLKGSDKKLPQIQRMRDLLSRGVAVHHGGLLPIVKEIVELLFQRGLVKVLFATETFAMGVNMPARSVVFSGIRKHDGQSFRELLAGEYTQMSGRAGRRGLDKTGVVIINAAEELPETVILHKMLLGQPTKLQSQFRLTYNMILNLLRVETLKVEEMIKRSFSENASQRLLPDQQKKIEERQKKLDKLPRVQPPEREEGLGVYYDAARSWSLSMQTLHDLALGQQQGSKIFTPGRLVVLYDEHFKNDVAVIVKQTGAKDFLILAAVSPERKKGLLDVDPLSVPPATWPIKLLTVPETELVYELREVPLTSFSIVTKHSFKIEQSMILAHRISAMNRTIALIQPTIEDLRQSSNLLDEEADWTKLRRLDFQEVVRSRDARAAEVSSVVPTEQHEGFDKDYRLTHARKSLEREIATLSMAMSSQNLELLPDYNLRISVLKALHFIDPVTESVLLKGRVACEVNSADELVLTELIVDNVFAQYTAEECVALLSVFVFQEKTDVIPELNERLQGGLDTILNTAERVSSIQAEHQLNYVDYAATLKSGLIPAVHAWASGTSFEEITQMTDVAEGTIVRVMTRLEQCCLEVRDAARVVGDLELKGKMEEGQAMIKRDILAAPSLYF
jgi:antiviral helicase SKI2